jgi:mono/diheme cytochrome c family protein
MKRIGAVAVMALLFIAACGKKEPQAMTAGDAARALQSDRPFSTAGLMRGVKLYQENCAQCHGPEAQGHPDWTNPQVTAAPPLDGNGNAWKRRKQDLVAIIRNGASRQGQPVMPAWKGRLSDQDIDDIIDWFQALWPADVYDRWQKANAGTAAPKS